MSVGFGAVMSRNARKFTPTERRGIVLTEELFLSFPWIFRDQPVLDFGLDAEVEVCEGAQPTARLLKLQIKSGPSWFERRSADGWIFRDSVEHFEYWLRCTVPVIVVLCDPDNDVAYWVQIEPDAIKYAEKEASIVVPRDQRLSPDQADRLRDIAFAGLSSEFLKTLPAPNKLSAEDLRRSVKRAKKSVDIAAPYLPARFVELINALPHAVRVRALVAPDDTVSRRLLLEAEHRGVQIEVRTLTSLHMKQVTIDGDQTIAGSHLDPRSGGPEVLFLVTSRALEQSFHKAFSDAWSRAAPRDLAQPGL